MYVGLPQLYFMYEYFKCYCKLNTAIIHLLLKISVRRTDGK